MEYGEIPQNFFLIRDTGLCIRTYLFFEEHKIRFNLIFASSCNIDLEVTERSLRSIIDSVEKISLPIDTKNSPTPTDNEAKSPTAESPIKEDVELPDRAQSPTAESPAATKRPIDREVELADGAICEYESLCPGIFDEDGKKSHRRL